MSLPFSLSSYFRLLERSPLLRWQGRVTRAVGQMVESDGPVCSVGECCEIVDSEGSVYLGEIVGFRERTVLSMPLQRPEGIRYGDSIITGGIRPTLRVGEGLVGRVIDATGRPLDEAGSYPVEDFWPLDGTAPQPLERVPIRQPLGCGVRAIDAFLTCGKGQRLGIFGGSGVGKSTLVGMMARGTSADLTVLALVGERGREVREFLEALGEQGRKRSVVIVSTSDQSPLLRIRAALAATAVAEYFQSQGKNVLLVVDSLTRLAMAQREVGLAAGEPPTAKGYTPSVFSLLSRLVERAGNFRNGSITAFYSVLMEGDDQQDTIVDAVRGLLDGHIVLDRRLSMQGHFPSISVLDSLSRLMPAVCAPEHIEKARSLRRLFALYSGAEDLIRVGAYQRGLDLSLDQAVNAFPLLSTFLRQDQREIAPISQTIQQLLAFAS